MDLLRLNSIFEGKYKEEASGIKIRTITEEELGVFRELLSISDSYILGVSSTDSHEEFFATYDLLNKAVEDEIKEDLFYAAKLGFFYRGIPSRLVYILQKAIRKYNTPNNAINSLDIRGMSKYLKRGNLPEGVTLKQVMENLIGREFDLLTSYRRSARFKDDFEVYVQNTDRVLILPKGLATFVDSQEDLQTVEYVKNIGVCVQGMPIRTIDGRIGLTLNEYDLRECR